MFLSCLNGYGDDLLINADNGESIYIDDMNQISLNVADNFKFTLGKYRTHDDAQIAMKMLQHNMEHSNGIIVKVPTQDDVDWRTRGET